MKLCSGTGKRWITVRKKVMCPQCGKTLKDLQGKITDVIGFHNA